MTYVLRYIEGGAKEFFTPVEKVSEVFPGQLYTFKKYASVARLLTSGEFKLVRQIADDGTVLLDAEAMPEAPAVVEEPTLEISNGVDTEASIVTSADEAENTAMESVGETPRRRGGRGN